jgi:hypothetical protein
MINTLRKGTHSQHLCKWDSVRTHVRHNSNTGYQVATFPLRVSAKSTKTSQCLPILRNSNPSATRLAADAHAPKDVEEVAIIAQDRDNDDKEADVDVDASVGNTGLITTAGDASVAATTGEASVTGVIIAAAAAADEVLAVEEEVEDATVCASAKRA